MVILWVYHGIPNFHRPIFVGRISLNPTFANGCCNGRSAWCLKSWAILRTPIWIGFPRCALNQLHGSSRIKVGVHYDPNIIQNVIFAGEKQWFRCPNVEGWLSTEMRREVSAEICWFTSGVSISIAFHCHVSCHILSYLVISCHILLIIAYYRNDQISKVKFGQ